jgi:hypothetical protein
MFVNGETYNEPRHAKEIVGAGAVTGLLGGLVLVVAAAITGAMVGVPPADFARGISAVFRGDAAMAGAGGDVLLGLLIHFAVAVATGVLFAWLIGRATSGGKALGGALVYSLALWAIMLYVVARAAAPQFVTISEAAPWWAWLVSHLLYGLPLALSPMLQRRIGRVPGPRAQPDHEWVGRHAQVPTQGEPLPQPHG